jgi:hypothetical protein
METNTPARDGAGTPQKSTANVVAAIRVFFIFVVIRIWVFLHRVKPKNRRSHKWRLAYFAPADINTNFAKRFTGTAIKRFSDIGLEVR